MTHAIRLAACALLSCALVAEAAGQDTTSSTARARFDLSTMFEQGHLVTDPNGDSVPDFVDAALVVGSSPSAAELHAATEIAARLGFETMALDLPMARGAETAGIPIVIGRGGLSAVGVSPGVDPTSLDDGEGSVVAREVEGRRFVIDS